MYGCSSELIATLIPSSFTGTIDVGTGQMTSVIDLANAMGMGHLPIKEDTPNEPDELCVISNLSWNSVGFQL